MRRRTCCTQVPERDSSPDSHLHAAPSSTWMVGFCNSPVSDTANFDTQLLVQEEKKMRTCVCFLFLTLLHFV